MPTKAKTLPIVVTTSCAGDGFAYQPGERVDAPEDRAIDLLNAGYAEAVVVTPAKRARKAETRVTKDPETR